MERIYYEVVSQLALHLNKYDVEYMFVGGFAVGFYDQYRVSTNMSKGIDYDLDIWYRATNDNFIKLSKALAEFRPE